MPPQMLESAGVYLGFLDRVRSTKAIAQLIDRKGSQLMQVANL